MYVKSANRLKQIVKVLTFYGFGYIVDNKLKNNKSPENLRKAFEELGPTFIKIGQILSTRPDILSQDYIQELSKLQDQAPEENFESINKVFFNEFDKNIKESFLYFNEKPMASASIAQVHEGILEDGREVVVKIQRPDIEENMRIDISILMKLIKVAKIKFIDTLIDPIQALNEILESTERELDFKIEAENIRKFKALNEQILFVDCPYVVNEYSRTKVLTMENIKGFKINNKESLKEGEYDLYDLGQKLALSYFKQVFEDGFFHGDPHPGNLLIREGKICYIDFGIVGELSPSLRKSLNDAVIAVAYKDVDKIISVIMTIGIKRGKIDRNKLYEDIDYLLASYLSTSLKDIKISEMLQEVFETARSNNIQLPKEFTLLVRSMVIIEGVVAEVCPEIKIIDIAVPFVKKQNGFSFVNSYFDIEENLLKLHNLNKSLTSLPSKTIELINSILSGRAKVQLNLSNIDKSINQLNRMTNRVAFAMIVGAMVIASSLILNSNIGPKVYNMSIIGVTGYAISAIFGIYLLVSIIKSGNL